MTAKKATPAASSAEETGADAPAQGSPTPGAENASESVAMPTVGRIVHVRVARLDSDPEIGWRPAIVIDSDDYSGHTRAMCHVFLCAGDYPFANETRMWAEGSNAFVVLREQDYGDGLGQWRWPPRD